MMEGRVSYLIAAYAVFWAISFGLVASMVVRQRKLRADLHLLRQLVESDEGPASDA